jgi:hypothetical protein
MDPMEQDHVLDLCVLDIPQPLLDHVLVHLDKSDAGRS